MLAILLITLVIVALYIGLMQYYAWGWILTPLFEPKKNHQPITKVTVIIPARNEADNIERVVQCLLAQDYPNELLEVLVIDDHSEDGTADIVSRIANQQLSGNVPQIHTLPEGLKGKKAAITYGIAHAGGDLIITTDADCSMGTNWMGTIAQYYENHNYKVLTGPVAFCPSIRSKPIPNQPINPRQRRGKQTNQLLHHFQSLDLMGLMFITAGSLRFNFPHMANGANFAFEKKLFDTIGGYSGIDHTPTGDDILFLLKAHGHHPGCAGFVKAKEAIVTTSPARTWGAFWQQRLRWVSKSTGFSDFRLTAILSFYYLYALAMVTAGAGMFFNPFMILPFLLLSLGKWISELVMLAHATIFFGRTRELLWFLPSQMLHVYYVLRIGIQAQVSKYAWKGRRY